MTTATTPRNAGALLLCAVLLISINLRMSITAVGPLIDEIGADQQISAAALGLLSALPLLVWGLVSPLAHTLSVRFGTTHAITGGLIILLFGTVWRSLPGLTVNLWIGSALLGTGLAICNALVPAVFKHNFPKRVPLLMGVYTAVLGGTGALGAGLAVPLSQIAPSGSISGWQFSLLMFGLPLPFALLLWVLARRRRTNPAAPVADAAPHTPSTRNFAAGKRIWRDPVAWLVSLYTAAQSAIFYGVASWLAPYGISLGMSPVDAGIMVMAISILGIFSSLSLPFLTRIPAMHTAAPALFGAVLLVALMGMFIAPSVMPLWIILFGLGVGASFTLALTLMTERARTTEHATALSGMGQSIGYAVGAVGPFAFGALLDISGGWIVPFALLWIFAIGQLLLGVALRTPRFVLDTNTNTNTDTDTGTGGRG